MPSTLAWLDHDEAAKRSTISMIQLFKDEGTVDELGIGSIRDTIADALFPGTSVLHTRARYLLFIPWLLNRTADRGLPPDAALEDLRHAEVRLIESLMRGGETDGVIGQQARSKLKRKPSAAYWAATYRYGIRRWDTTVEGYFRRSRSLDRLRKAAPAAEDGDVAGQHMPPGTDPDLPPPPDDLLRSVSFALTGREGEYLTDRILMAAPGSLLAWLAEHTNSTAGEWIWQHPQMSSFPRPLRRIVDHGRRFHTAMHGAALLYNLQLSEKSQRPERATAYRDELHAWRDELALERPLERWDRDDFWNVVLRRNPRIFPSTRRFVDDWLTGVEASDQVEDSRALLDLVRHRELRLKGGRARLVNQSALDAWRGASGLVRLDYRWAVARRLLRDIYDSRRAA